MVTVLVTGAIRIGIWLTLFLVSCWRRYPVFALMGLFGMLSNVALCVATLDTRHATTWLTISGAVGVILIPIIVGYAFQGMFLRDKMRHPLTAEDLLKK